MARALLIPGFAVLMLCCACKKSSPGKETPATTEEDAGSKNGMDAATVDAGHSAGSGTGGRSASGGKLDAGRTKLDAGRKSTADGGTRDAMQAPADPSECSGVHCAEPTVCERDAGLPHCVCPPGYDFVDVGGAKSPCVPHCEGDCDAS